MPPFSMEAKSSSPGDTSGDEMDGSPCDSQVEPVPRRRRSGKAQKKDKNRDAARKSRRRQTEKADELHMEHQCLERSNTYLVKEIAALQAEVRHYMAVLEHHEPVCSQFALSLTSTLTPTSTSPTTAAAALHHGSSHRPSEAPCPSPDSDPSGASDVASPDRTRVSEAAACALLPSCSPPRPPPYPLPGHPCPASWPGGLATSRSQQSFPLPSARLLTTPSFWDHPPPPPLCPSSSSPSPSSSSSSSIHIFDSHPLPPLTPSGPPSSFTPPHLAPAPAPALSPGLAYRSDRQGSFAGADGTVLPHHPHQTPYPGVPSHGNHRSYLGNRVHESSSIHAYPSGLSGSNMASGPGPYGGFAASGPTPLLPPLASLDLVDSPTAILPRLLPPLCNFSSDVFFLQLLQTDDVLFPDC